MSSPSHFSVMLYRMGFYRAPDGRWHADWRFIDPTLWLGVHL